MAAGLATVGHLREHGAEIYARLESVSAAVADGLAAEAARAGVAMTTNRVGAMWTWFFTESAVRDFTGAATSDTERFARFHRAMLEQGVWLPPSQYEAAFLSAAHTPVEVEATMAAARTALEAVCAASGQAL